MLKIPPTAPSTLAQAFERMVPELYYLLVGREAPAEVAFTEQDHSPGETGWPRGTNYQRWFDDGIFRIDVHCWNININPRDGTSAGASFSARAAGDDRSVMVTCEESQAGVTGLEVQCEGLPAEVRDLVVDLLRRRLG